VVVQPPRTLKPGQAGLNLAVGAANPKKRRQQQQEHCTHVQVIRPHPDGVPPVVDTSYVDWITSLA